MKINLKVSEVNEAIAAIDAWLDHGPHSYEDPEHVILAQVIRKLREARDVDRWNPMSQLPPLGIKVMVRDKDLQHQFLAVRTELADSYSPSSLVMEVNGEDKTLKTGDYQWTIDYV